MILLNVNRNIYIFINSIYNNHNINHNLISALKKLTIENLSNLTPHWLNVSLNYSHPPVVDRIHALKSSK